MSRSNSPDRKFSSVPLPPDPASPAHGALGQLCALLESLTAAPPPQHFNPQPSLFDADNLCLYCESPLTHTSPSSGALLLLPSAIELPCGHRLCRSCYSGVIGRRRTCPVPLCDRALPADLFLALPLSPPQSALSTSMIKSKSEPSLFPPTASVQQTQGAAALSSSGASGGQAFRRVPSLGQLQDTECDGDAQGLAPDRDALTLPLHLLDVASVKVVVNGADVFDVAHDFTPSHAQAAVEQQFFAATVTDSAANTDDATQAMGVISLSPPMPLPLYIRPSAPLLPARVRASKGDISPVPTPCLRLPWHLQLPPVVHTFTLKTEHPGKPGTRPLHRDT
jgi:hypothetical protein